MSAKKQPVGIGGALHWKCSKCEELKLSFEFSADSRRSNGLRSCCRSCAAKMIGEWRAVNREHIREYDAKRRNTPEFRELNRRKTKRQRLQNRASCRSYYAANREKFRAKESVLSALSAGILSKPTCCEMCGVEAELDGHHDSYERDRWLVVTWLCRRCHKWTHARRQKGGTK